MSSRRQPSARPRRSDRRQGFDFRQQRDCYLCHDSLESRQQGGRYSIERLQCGHWVCNSCWGGALVGPVSARLSAEKCGLCREPTGFTANVTEAQRSAHAMGLMVDSMEPIQAAVAAPAAVARVAIVPAANHSNAATALVMAADGPAQVTAAVAAAPRVRQRHYAAPLGTYSLFGVPPARTLYSGRALSADGSPNFFAGVPYTPGGYCSLIDGGSNPHAVLHAQRRSLYRWLTEVSVATPGAVFVDVGGRPDIVETFVPSPQDLGARWRYMCPLLMDEDYDREDATSKYVESGLACRCKVVAGGRETCVVCDVVNPIFVFMHSAYYVTPTDIAALCEEGPVVICGHQFRGFDGRFEFRRGGDIQCEASWERDGDDVTMEVQGNNYTYRHSAMAWLREGRSGCFGGRYIEWRRIATVGDFSISADPMAPTSMGTDVYEIVRSTQERCAVAVPAPLSRRVSVFRASLAGTDFVYNRDVTALQITATGRMSGSATLSWESFDRVTRVFAAQQPAVGWVYARARAQLTVESDKLQLVLMAARAFVRRDLETLSESMLADKTDANAITARLAGMAPSPPVLGAIVGAAVGGAVGRTRLAALGGAVAGSFLQREVVIVREIGFDAYCNRTGISPSVLVAGAAVAVWAADAAVRGAAGSVVLASCERLSVAALNLATPAVAPVNPTTLQRIRLAMASVAARSAVAASEAQSQASGENLRRWEGRAVAAYQAACDLARPLLSRVTPATAGSIQAAQRIAWNGASQSVRVRRAPIMAMYLVLYRFGLLRLGGSLAWLAGGGEATYLLNEMGGVVVEEHLKDYLDCGLRYLGAHWLADHHVGHVSFALGEMALKIGTLGPQGGVILGSSLAAAMHIAISGLSRDKRVLLHSLWNLWFLGPGPVRAASVRAAAGEFGKMVFDCGNSVHQALRFGNYVAGQFFDNPPVYEPEPMREGAVIMAPNPFAYQAPKSKPMMVVGPLYHGAILPLPAAVAWTEANELRCLRNRVLMDTPAIDRQFFQGAYAPLHGRLIRELFGDDVVIAVSRAAWLGTFPPARRARLLLACEHVDADPLCVVRHRTDGVVFDPSQKKLFLKAEQTEWDKDPRGIQAGSDESLVVGGPWFMGLSQAFKSRAAEPVYVEGVWVTIGIGLSKTESFERLRYHIQRGEKCVIINGDDSIAFDGRRVYSIDAKRWDAHTRRELLQLGNDAWRRLGCPKIAADLLDIGLSRSGRTVTGYRYETDGNTASGDPDTIQKNGVTGAPVIILALKDPRPFAFALDSIGRRLGLRYTFVDREGIDGGDLFRMHRLEFCSCYPVLLSDGTWGASPKLGRVSARFGLSQVGLRPEVALWNKAKSLQADAAHSTLLSHYAARALSAAGEQGRSRGATLAARRWVDAVTNVKTPVDLEWEDVQVQMRYGHTRADMIRAIDSVWDGFVGGVIEISSPEMVAAVEVDF